MDMSSKPEANFTTIHAMLSTGIKHLFINGSKELWCYGHLQVSYSGHSSSAPRHSGGGTFPTRTAQSKCDLFPFRFPLPFAISFHQRPLSLVACHCEWTAARVYTVRHSVMSNRNTAKYRSTRGKTMQRVLIRQKCDIFLCRKHCENLLRIKGKRRK